MNILHTSLNSEKPAITSLMKSADFSQFVVALAQGQVLAKHVTHQPTTFLLLSGRVCFTLPNEKHEFNTGDYFLIPVGELHEVLGLDQRNIFLITKWKE